MNRINEIGNTKKGQEMLGRTAERAYQRAQRTSGADKKRYEKTFSDAYRTGGKSANKHLGGSREHFDNGRDYEHEKWEKEHNGNVAESKNMNKKLIRLTESDLHKIVKESASKIINEIGGTPKGQRGLGALHARKVLRNNDLSDDTYNYAQNARGGDKYDNRGNNENPLYHDYANGYIDYLNSHPDEYIANKRKRMSESYLHRIVKESVNRILSEDQEGYNQVMSTLNNPTAQKGLKKAWNKERKKNPNADYDTFEYNHALNLQDKKRKEDERYATVKESVNRILKESDYRGLSDGHYDMPEGSTIEALVKEIEKDYNSASKPFYSRGEYNAGRQGQIDSYLSSMTKAIVNDFSKEDYLKALEMFGLNIRPEAMQEFDRNWNFCIQDLQDEIRRSHQAWAEDRMSDMGFGYEGD